MNDASASRRAPTLAQTAIVWTATLAAIALLSWVLAYWTWVWLAPRPEPRVPPAEVAATDASSAHLFGTPSRDTRIAAVSDIGMRLLGVAAGSGHTRGYAILQVGGKDIVAVREGEPILTGIRLAEVHADHVVLDRNGARVAMAWPEQNPGHAIAAGPSATAGAPATSPHLQSD